MLCERTLLLRKWNRAFADSEVLEQFPDEEGGGWVITARIKVSWPFKDRIYVVFAAPPKRSIGMDKKPF